MSLTHRLFAQSVRDLRAMPAVDVEAASRPLLGRLLDHAAKHVPFYAPLAPVLAAAAAGDLSAWTAVPVLRAAERCARAVALLSDQLPSGEWALDDRSWTSLSTPVAGPFGFLADVADKAQWEYLVRRAGMDPGLRLAAILPPDALRPGDLAEGLEPWSLDADRGRAHRWSEEFEPEATLVWLGHVRPSALFVRPVYLERLLDAAPPGRLALSEVLLAGAALDPATGARCADLFGARLLEGVISDAAGFVASADAAGRFVPATETIVVEILDDRGLACRPGETGRLVCTALYGYRRTAIRHDLGLEAAWDEDPSDAARDHRPAFRLSARRGSTAVPIVRADV